MGYVETAAFGCPRSEAPQETLMWSGPARAFLRVIHIRWRQRTSSSRAHFLSGVRARYLTMTIRHAGLVRMSNAIESKPRGRKRPRHTTLSVRAALVRRGS